MTKKNEVVVKTESTEEIQDAVIVAPAGTPTIANEFIAEKKLSEVEAAQTMQILAKISAYVGATSHRADEFLGQVVTIYGAITQPVQIGHDFVNTETGEESRAYSPAVRTILKLENGDVISMVSKSAESFVNTFLFPAFGKGDFSVPVKLKITQIPKGQNRTFNFQIVF